MKFTVEIEDDYIEEGELIEAFKKALIASAVNKLMKEVKEDAKSQYEAEVKRVIEGSIKAEIITLIEGLRETAVVKSRSDSNKLVPLKDYVLEYFTYAGNWSTFPEHIKDVSKKYAEEFKKKYDHQFASAIVEKMKEAGLLRQDIASLLLPPNS